MSKISRKVKPNPLLPIEDETLATLIDDTEEQAALHRLSPLDYEKRLYMSCNFPATSSTTDELPSAISQNIVALKLAIQRLLFF